MSDADADRDALALLLARAFDLAWMQYYEPGRTGTISEDIARPALATHLVEMAKNGVMDEEALAACGILRLISLSPLG